MFPHTFYFIMQAKEFCLFLTLELTACIFIMLASASLQAISGYFCLKLIFCFEKKKPYAKRDLEF